MYEMMERSLASLGVFVGTGECNANCANCAGIPHRGCSPKFDGGDDYERIRQTLRDCYDKGARSLSLSGSGEPTLSPLSVTKAMMLVYEVGKEGRLYPKVNLYSNGIRIGEDKPFCERYLPLWKSLGLKTIYVTVHDINEENNARVYGVKSYPNLKGLIGRIHERGLLMRANLVLGKRNIGTLERFVEMVNGLRERGADSISSWPIRGIDDKVDLMLSPPKEELDKMADWIEKNNSHSCKVRVYGEEDRISYTHGHKLTLFPDGTLSGSWCN